MTTRYTMDAQDLYDGDRPLRDTDIMDRLNEQDEDNDTLRATVQRLRGELSSAHEHVGALVAACDTAGTLIELHDPNADALLQIELTTAAARAWLRRAAQ